MAATRVPGLKWDALEVWEASALPGAWDDVDGYLDFRTYALDRLSDLGFLDILLDDLRASAAPVLRVIADCGDYTGMTVLLVGAAAAAASSSGRSSRSKSQKDSDGAGDDADEDGTDGRGFTIAYFTSSMAPAQVVCSDVAVRHNTLLRVSERLESCVISAYLYQFQ